MAEYIARVSAKGGKKLHTTEPHPTREDAAKAAFKARPNARSVSTSVSHEGKEAHRDIRWHNKDELMKPKPVEEGSRQNNKGNNMRRSNIVRENIAKLLEDVMEKSVVVTAAKGIVDKLQSYAEELSTVEAKQIMPMYDSLSTAFGPQVADQFNTTATDQIRQLITAIQGAKSAIDGEIHRMEQGIEGGDMSDMAMDAPPDPAMDGPPPPPGGAPPPPGDAPPDGLPEIPGGDELPSDADNVIDGGFAGRARKENAQPRGQLMKETWRARLQARRGKLKENDVREDFLDKPVGGAKPSAPAVDLHPHKSVDFAANVGNLAVFHGAAGKLARNIESMIDSDPLTGEERKALANVLSHFAGFAEEPSHWSNAESKLKMSLEQAGIWDSSKPVVSKIVTELRKLAHLISFKHQGMIESAIKQLKVSPDPDGLVFNTFRVKLAETRDAQTAAIRTARTFGIDIEDVVTIVREAAADRDRYGEKAIREAAKKAEAKTEKDCAVCKGSGKVKGKKCFVCAGNGKAKEAVKESPDDFKKKSASQTPHVKKTKGSERPWENQRSSTKKSSLPDNAYVGDKESERKSVKEAPIPDNFKKSNERKSSLPDNAYVGDKESERKPRTPVKEVKKEQAEDGSGKFKVNHISPDKKTKSNDRFETKAEAQRYAAGLRKKGYHDVNLTEESEASFGPVDWLIKMAYNKATKKSKEKAALAREQEEQDERDRIEQRRVKTVNAAKAKAAQTNPGLVLDGASSDLKSVKEAPIPDNFKKGNDKPADKGEKKDKWQKPWEKKEEVNEELPQNTSMFPVQAGAPNTAPNPGISNPAIANPGQAGQPTMPGPSGQSTQPVGGQNNNTSTNKPMTPNDMRARQQANTSANTPANGQQPGQVPPTGGNTVVPPTEADQGVKAPSTQPRMAPTNPVKKPQFNFQSQ